MRFSSHDTFNRGASVESGGDGPAGFFDGADCAAGCARYHDMHRLLNGISTATTEQLDAFSDLVDAARVGQFSNSNWSGRIDATLVDPFLESVDVQGC